MKKIFRVLFVLIFCLSAILTVGSFRLAPVYASNGIVMNTNYREYGLSRPMFDILLELYREVKNTGVTYFESDFFDLQSGKFEREKSENADPDLINDLRAGVLNLTTGENAYACLKNLSKLTTVGDLSALSFSGVERLVLDDNAISSISPSNFNGFDDLRELSVRNNRLTSFELNSSYTGAISVLDLSNNALTTVNLNCLRTSADVDLSKNTLSDISSIIFPEVNLHFLDLSFNNLTEISDYTSLSQICHTQPVMLVQGLNKDKFVTGDKVTVFNQDGTGRLVMNVSYQPTSAYYSLGLITSSSGEAGFDAIHMPAGKIRVTFEFDSLPTGASAVNLISRNIDCLPPTPTYHTVCDGVSKSETSYSSNFDLVIDYNLPDNIANKQTLSQDSVLTIKSGQNTLTGTSFPITKTGTFSFSAVAQFDGLYGDTLYVSVTKQNPASFTIIIIFVVGIIIVAVATAVLISFFKSGGQVAPLNSRELNAIKRRESRRYGREYDFGDYEASTEVEDDSKNSDNDDDYLDLDDEDD